MRAARLRVGAALAVLGCAGPLLTTAPAGAATSATPAASNGAPTALSITGHGWGHGRGMGQWGALGYAAAGWPTARILNHFYGGTHARRVGSPTISVELLRYAGRPVTLTGSSLRVNGQWTSGAVRVNRVAPGRLQVSRAAGCGGAMTPWFTASSVQVKPAGDTRSAAAAVQVCESGGTRGYRGSIRLFEGGGRFRIANRVSVENYLLGVVPREMPAAWGDVASGRGSRALQAQAVAARSYALASHRTYTTTCDTTACQVYGGWYRVRGGARTILEDPRTTRAVIATRGLVRAWPGGWTAHTEFSSSTGGVTAGGAFGSVRDLGDARAGNPWHSWQQQLDWATVQNRLRLGPLQSVVVLSRSRESGIPARVTAVRVRRADGSAVTLSGTRFRTLLGLHSTWFSLHAK